MPVSLALTLTCAILQEAAVAVEREVDDAFWFFPRPPRVARVAASPRCVGLACVLSDFSKTPAGGAGGS